MLSFSRLIPVRFAKRDLMDGERIIKSIRRHPFYIFKKLILVSVITIGSWIGTIYMSVFVKTVSTEIADVISLVTVVLFILINIYFFIRFFYVWIDYHFDNVIITDFRVIYIDRHFIYGQSVKEITLDRITTVRSTVNNIVANILGYARLDIDSADDGQHITFDFTPTVDDIRIIIMRQKERFKEHSANGLTMMYENAVEDINDRKEDKTGHTSPRNVENDLREENIRLKNKIRELEERLNY